MKPRSKHYFHPKIHRLFSHHQGYQDVFCSRSNVIRIPIRDRFPGFEHSLRSETVWETGIFKKGGKRALARKKRVEKEKTERGRKESTSKRKILDNFRDPLSRPNFAPNQIILSAFSYDISSKLKEQMTCSLERGEKHGVDDATDARFASIFKVCVIFFCFNPRLFSFLSPFFRNEDSFADFVCAFLLTRSVSGATALKLLLLTNVIFLCQLI